MDHMMPTIDGIETTKRLRSLGYAAPIVALTANALVGQADVFLENGFDDFISKPIDMRQLNAVLKKFIRPKESAAQKKPKQPIAYPALGEIFVRDAKKAIAVLEQLQKKSALGDEDMRLYTINVHGMKSALANIGETELSAAAARLEQAGRDRDVAAVKAGIQMFLDGLKALVEKLAPPAKDGETVEASKEDSAYLCERLLLIKEACVEFDKKTVKETLVELKQKTWASPTERLLDEMSALLLEGDFEAVSKAAQSFLDGV